MLRRGGSAGWTGRGPKWEEMAYTAVVFVRVANTGVAGYGKRKSAQALDRDGHRSLNDLVFSEEGDDSQSFRLKRADAS
jgi:hypothetical protein